jgi:ketosteroid isomerase-like protein
MMHFTRASLIFLAATGSLLSGCHHDHRPRDTDKVAAEVRRDALALVSDYNSGNAEAAAAQDAPDYVGVFHGAPNTVGPAADLAGMKQQIAAGKAHWGETKVTVSRAGDIGLFEAPYTYTFTDTKGGAQRESGNWIAIFKRQDDGTMKLWRSIGSDLPAATAGRG